MKKFYVVDEYFVEPEDWNLNYTIKEFIEESKDQKKAYTEEEFVEKFNNKELNYETTILMIADEDVCIENIENRISNCQDIISQIKSYYGRENIQEIRFLEIEIIKLLKEKEKLTK